MKNKIITSNTMYLEEKETEIIIHELSTDEIIINNASMRSIIDNSCLFYGSSYAGRLKSSKTMLQENYKLPIFINEIQNLIAFPLNSLRTKKSIWLIYNNIANYHQISKSKVLVEFKNGKMVTFSVSYYIFHNQILKCQSLMVIYHSRNQISF